MKLIVCVDKTNGLSFNHRRQSRDRAVAVDIAAHYAPVRMSATSAPLFAAWPEHIAVSEDFLTAAKPGEACFAEALPLPDAPEELILYRWDRDYPADERLPYDLSRWNLRSAEPLAGHSHALITKEIYTK